MTTLLAMLAQTTAPAAPPPTGGVGDLLRSPLVPMILALVVLWWIMARGRSKERQKYEQMLASLKKNDRVQTIGGIIGTVADVRDNIIVLKVDETNNVKIHFNRAAIKEVLKEAPPAGKE
jgi:preprotein translocase subunit YajC